MLFNHTPRLIRCFMLLLIAALVLPIALRSTPARAQDGLSDEERELLGVVQTAVTTFHDQDSYTYAVEQATASEMEMMGQAMSSSTTQLIAGETINGADGTATHLTFEMTTETGLAAMPAAATAQTLGYEIIKIGDETYIRFTEVDENLAMMSSMGGFSFPEEWTLVDEATATSNPMVSAYSATGDFALSYLPVVGFNAENFNSVTELDGDEIDGQAMRVIELAWNPEAVSSGNLLGVNAAIANQAVGALGGSAPAPAPEEPNTEAIQGLVDGMVITQKVWIGVDDGLPHRIELTTSIDGEIAAAGMTVPLVQENVTTVNFTEFNTALTIEAPTVE